MGLHLEACLSPRLKALCDADWGSDPIDRRSISCFCIYFGNNLMFWISKKQSVVARSSTEAEYRALAVTVAEVVWLQSLLLELHYQPYKEPPIIYCDNLSAVLMSANPVLHSRTKHLELDVYFVREKVQQGIISVCHISAKDPIADTLTKPLSKGQFLLLRDKLKVQNIPLSLRGK